MTVLSFICMKLKKKLSWRLNKDSTVHTSNFQFYCLEDSLIFFIILFKVGSHPAKYEIYIVTSLVREGIKCRRAILWPPQLRTLAG